MNSSQSTKDLLNMVTMSFQEARPLLPMYAHLIVSALFPIYTGAHASLSRPSSAAKPARDSQDTSRSDDDDHESQEVQRMEGLSPSDAIIFPVTAACVLAVLYFLIKFYGPDMINLILGLYFGLIGLYSVGKLINDGWGVAESFVFPSYYWDRGTLWKIAGGRKAVPLDTQSGNHTPRDSPMGGLLGRLKLPKMVLNFLWAVRDESREKFVVHCFAKGAVNFSVRVLRRNVASAVIGIAAIAYSVLIGRPWWLTNIQGFAVCYEALQFMSPTTFATGSLILMGLFLYDVWAVFFTPLMITVAQNLDVPIKLVFPRPDEPSSVPGEPPIKSFGMLGLGDIVLPGIIIALALRFDLYLFYLKKQKAAARSTLSSNEADAKEVVKAPYVPVTGRWGDRILTLGCPSSALPARLNTNFPKPYFMAAMSGYVFGMLATLGVMSIWKHPQPALLYLVPGVLLSLWSTGLIRGELKPMWEFTEDITTEPLAEGKAQHAKLDNQKEQDDEVKSRSLFARFWVELFGDSKAASKNAEPQGEPSNGAKPAPQKDSAHTGESDLGENVLFSLKVTRQTPPSATGKKGTESGSEKDGAPVGEPKITSESKSETNGLSQSPM